MARKDLLLKLLDVNILYQRLKKGGQNEHN